MVSVIRTAVPVGRCAAQLVTVLPPAARQAIATPIPPAGRLPQLTPLLATLPIFPSQRVRRLEGTSTARLSHF